VVGLGVTLVVSFCVLIEDPGNKVDIPNVKFRQHGFDDRRISLFSFDDDGRSSVGFVLAHIYLGKATICVVYTS